MCSTVLIALINYILKRSLLSLIIIELSREKWSKWHLDLPLNRGEAFNQTKIEEKLRRDLWALKQKQNEVYPISLLPHIIYFIFLLLTQAIAFPGKHQSYFVTIHKQKLCIHLFINFPNIYCQSYYTSVKKGLA